LTNYKKKSLRVVFFGTPSFAASVLETLVLKESIEVVGVVSRPDKPHGRKKIIKNTSVKQKIIDLESENPHKTPLFQPIKASDPEFIEKLRELKPDLFVVVAYGEILSQTLLDLPQIAAINIHASLLPKYRGAAPIQRSLMNGDQKTGITIMHMVKELDAGDIILQEDVSMTQNMTFGELEELLKAASYKALSKSLLQFQMKTSSKTPQNAKESSYAQKITPQDQVINWDNLAEKIHNQIRALSPKPGAWTNALFKNEKIRLKILESELFLDHSIKLSKGELFLTPNKEWIVGTGEGIISLKKIQLPGKKVTSTLDFLRGYSNHTLTLLQ
jgi:methionyl-tRNA formyltransferase